VPFEDLPPEALYDDRGRLFSAADILRKPFRSELKARL
jgi:hypothetical protein